MEKDIYLQKKGFTYLKLFNKVMKLNFMQPIFKLEYLPSSFLTPPV